MGQTRKSMLQNTVFSVTFSYNVHYVHKQLPILKEIQTSKRLVKNQNRDL